MLGTRLFRRLLAPFIGLAVLFVGANLVLEQVAETQVADNVKRSFDLPRKPSVNITAFPIVLRLLDHRIPAVTVTATGVTTEGLRLRTLRVTLEGIDVGFDVLGEPGASLRVDRARAVAEATQQDVNRFLAREGVEGRVTFRAAGVTVRATPVIAGRRRVIVARGRLAVRAGVLSFAPSSVTVDGRRPDARTGARARSETSFRVRLPLFPGDFRPAALSVGAGVARLTATASGYRLRLSA